MKLTAEQQCAVNCLAWWAKHGGLTPRITKAEPDRVWLEKCGLLVGHIKRLAAENVLVEAYAKNHGPTVIIGYREARTRTAAQVIIHTHAVEMDFDHWHPWDLVGLVGHGWEVATNKLGRRKTDPEKIAAALRKRGINA
jgi:hypothetical protein